jgi:acyl-CoA synthetase (AMP-forming)/AMP-acid ligase II
MVAPAASFLDVPSLLLVCAVHCLPLTPAAQCPRACCMLQGYGMTETCCVISMTSHGDAMGGHVGGPVVCCEIKLVDIPEMNYTNADKPHPRGEVSLFAC